MENWFHRTEVDVEGGSLPHSYLTLALPRNF